MTAQPDPALDLDALRRTAEIYARGADRRSKDDWGAVLAEEAEIVGPGFAAVGLDALLVSIDHLAAMFKTTRHIVHDMDVIISGDTAEGETRCTAEHRLPANDVGDVLLVWAIRYRDRWKRDAGGWKFTRRELIVDWEEVRQCRDVTGSPD
jgi:hypothetical protein